MKFSLTIIAIILAICSTPTFANTDEETITIIKWSPDGDYIATGHVDGSIKIWDWNTQTIYYEFEAHQSYIITLSWSPDGKFLVSSAYGEALHVWDISEAEIVTTIESETSNDTVYALAWSADGNQIIGGRAEYVTFEVWDAETGQIEFTRQEGAVADISYNVDNSRLALANILTITIVDADTFETLHILSQTEGTGIGFDVYPVIWHPDGNLIGSGTINGHVRIWDVENGKLILDLKGTTSDNKDTSYIRDLWFCGEGTHLLSVGGNGQLRLWDIDSGELLEEKYIESSRYGGAISPDGKFIAFENEQGKLEIKSVPLPCPESD